MTSENIYGKSNNNIELLIAILTYNGSLYIREAMDSIISQLDDVNEEVEIVVSDNALKLHGF